MDLVYLTGVGTNPDELRYSIRSMWNNLKGIRNLIIVGSMPDWLRNFKYIPCDDPHKNNPSRNIYEKILAAANDPETSDHFICCSDDYFLLKEYKASEFPYYHCGDLSIDLAKTSPRNYYRNHLLATQSILNERDLPTLNFNVHCPIVYNKAIFQEVMTGYDWTVKYGYVTKSLYSNSLRVPGLYMKDTKIHRPKTRAGILQYINGLPFFSTNEHSFNEELRQVVSEIFHEPSPWES